jgi:uncharacterized membrane protein required for colicin V production
MGPIELLFITIALIVTLIGMARGYVKELGNTVIVMSAIFLLAFFQDELINIMTKVGVDILGLPNPPNGFLSLFFSGVFIAIVFASYAGKTLDFQGAPMAPPGRWLLNLGVGLLNGYLIAGTLWYYEDTFDYPLRDITGFTEPLSARAQTMIANLPQNLFDNPVYWIIPVAILLILFVRK